MNDSNDDNKEINDLLSGAFPNTVLVNYIVIAETLTDDGRDLTIASSDGMTPWLANGMLKCAAEMIMAQQYAHDDDEENDND